VFLLQGKSPFGKFAQLVVVLVVGKEIKKNTMILLSTLTK